MTEWIKKEDVVSLLNEEFNGRSGYGDCFGFGFREKVNNLPTKQIEDEFNIGDEVWFLELNFDTVNRTYTYKPASCKYEGLLITIQPKLATDSEKQKVVQNIYKTREAAGQALKNIKNNV